MLHQKGLQLGWYWEMFDAGLYVSAAIAREQGVSDEDPGQVPQWQGAGRVGLQQVPPGLTCLLDVVGSQWGSTQHQLLHHGGRALGGQGVAEGIHAPPVPHPGITAGPQQRQGDLQVTKGQCLEQRGQVEAGGLALEVGTPGHQHPHPRPPAPPPRPRDL